MAILREMNFAQIVIFSRKTDAQRKKNFAFCSAKIAQKFANGNPTIILGLLAVLMPFYCCTKSWVYLLRFQQFPPDIYVISISGGLYCKSSWSGLRGVLLSARPPPSSP
jgi:hypothetical protein